MNQNEKTNQVRSSVLEENEKFKAAIASRDVIIAEQREDIKKLQGDIADRELTISSNIKELDIEKSLRIKAENLVANDKKLAQTGQEMYAPPKSKEEKFAEDYKEACRKLRENK